MSMWSTIGILFANSLIFLFTYGLRYREKVPFHVFILDLLIH